MTKETRANLIFLAVLAVLLIPGVSIVLTRAIYGKARKNSFQQPPIPHTQWAYMDPTPVSGLPRVTPPRVGSFIAQTTDRMLRLQPRLTSLVAGGDFRAVMSSA